jgi:hypothetical protein
MLTILYVAILLFFVLDFGLSVMIVPSANSVLRSIQAFYAQVNAKIGTAINSVWAEFCENWHEWVVVFVAFTILSALNLLIWFVAGIAVYILVRVISEAFGK